MKSAIDIITADAEADGIDTEQLLNNIALAIKSQQSVLLQKNDSVLLVTMISGSDAEVNLYTQDSPIVLSRSLKYFLEVLKNSPLRAIYGDSDDINFVNLLSKVGSKFQKKVQKSDLPNYTWMALL